MSQALQQESLFDEEEIGLPLAPLPRDRALVYDREAVLEAGFWHYRLHGFPYKRMVPRPVAQQEINRLAAMPLPDRISTLLGYTVADAYHPHRYGVRCSGMKTMLEAFADDGLLRKALARCYDDASVSDAMLRARLARISGTQSAANFRPGYMAYMIDRFCEPGGVVLDCCAGFGGRLVGFLASRASRYIGIEPASETFAGLLRCASDLAPAGAVELHRCAAEDFQMPDTLRADFAFTSPPYFAKEEYSHESTQSHIRYRSGEEWRDGFLWPLMRLQFACLHSGAYSGLNIADVNIGSRSYPLAAWATEAAQAAGFEFVGTEKYPISRDGAFLNAGTHIAAEPMLMFRKP